MTSLEEFFQTRSGWLFSLCASEDRGSSWGVPELFFMDVQNKSDVDEGCLILKSQVRGKVLNKDCHIRPGDGIAFYHSKRAEFMSGDEYKKRQRISLMGTFEECHQDGIDVSYIKVRIPQDVFDVISEEPIVWTPERDEAFTSCGLRDGPVRAFYPIPRDTWKGFLGDVAERIEEYTAESCDY
jgi:hypothetical protein